MNWERETPLYASQFCVYFLTDVSIFVKLKVNFEINFDKLRGQLRLDQKATATILNSFFFSCKITFFNNDNITIQ